MRALSLAILAATTAGCVGPIAPAVEAGPSALLTRVSTPSDHATGFGFRSEAAAGIVPPERTGPVVMLEGLGAYDTARGTQWSLRARGGYSIGLPYRAAFESALDVGTRIDGGIFWKAFEGGARMGFVLPLSPLRTPQDRSNAFVFFSQSIDVTGYARVGFQLGRGHEEATDASVGLALRAWFFSDLL